MKKPQCRSIYDLAELTGVSYATVSRVLNNRGRTSDATKKMVLKAANDYHFKPKMTARRKTVGIVTMLDHMLEHGFYGYIDTLLLSLLQHLSVKGYGIEFFSARNLTSLPKTLLDGLIAFCWDGNIAEIIRRMPQTPTVLMNSEALDGCSRVFSDHEQSGRMAAEYLIGKGHSKAGIILDRRLWGNRLRAEGFRKGCIENGAVWSPEFAGFLSEQTETLMIRNMLSSGVTAIFLGGEDIILPLQSAIRAMDLYRKIPLELISMENPNISRFQNPPMTTISQPFGEMVEKTVALLDEQIEKGVNLPREIPLDNTLIVRAAGKTAEK